MNNVSPFACIAMRTELAMRTKRILLFFVIAAMAASVPCFAQEQAPRPVYIHPVSVSSSLRQIVDALGDRVYEKGKERSIISGTLEYQGKSVGITVVKESPGYLRIELSGASPKTIVHDLNDLTSSRTKEESDEELAELFTSDSAEGFLQGMTQGGSLRKIGDSFVVEGAEGFGAKVDVYDLFSSVSVRQEKPYVLKHYLFDSDTGLLSRVAYSSERSGERIQVFLSDYQFVSEYRFPGKIIRKSGERITHAFTLQNGAVAPMGNDDLFKSVQ